MQYAAAAMCALTGEGDLRSGAVEFRAPLDQFFDPRRTFLDEYPRGVLIHQAVTGLQCVFQVKPDFIFIAQRSRNSALCVLCIGLGDFLLRKAEDTACGRKLHRST